MTTWLAALTSADRRDVLEGLENPPERAETLMTSRAQVKAWSEQGQLGQRRQSGSIDAIDAAIQTTSTSKARRLDFGDCGPAQPPDAVSVAESFRFRHPPLLPRKPAPDAPRRAGTFGTPES